MGDAAVSRDRFRLLEAARAIGIMPAAFLRETETFANDVAIELQRLAVTFDAGVTLAQRLCNSGMTYAELPGASPTLHPAVQAQVEIAVKYEGYIAREARFVEKALDMERVAIPRGMEYHAIKSLRFEAREKLTRVQPETLGQAARISGVNPADVAILAVLLGRRRAAR